MNTYLFTVLICFIIQAKVEANSTDFAELVKKKYFIDKTTFIRRFVEDKICDLEGTIDKILVITGPPGSGKSAIADMTRRYLQRQVEPDIGRPLAPEENTNYLLFCNETHPLKICEGEEGLLYAMDNLGRHPLIYLDFSPLNKSFCYNTFTQAMREIIAKAYRENAFLLDAVVPVMWEMRCNMTDVQFRSFMNLSVPMREDVIALGLLNLTAALKEYFDKPVFLIIDNYDTLYRNLMFEPRMKDHEDILYVVRQINKNLFKHNRGLRKALVTGRLRIKDPAITFLWNNYTEHRWLDDHEYATYYGFVKEEVHELVRRYVHGEEKINHTMHRIQEYYGGYFVQVQHTEMYSIDSVVKFLENNLKLQCYREEDIYFERAFVLFHVEQFENLAKDLLFDRHFVTVDLTEPLNFKTILALKQVRVELLYQSELQIEYFYTYMFDLGLLTPVPCSNMFISLVPVRLPNREAYLTFCRTILTCYKRDYRYDFIDMERFQLALSEIKPDSCYEQFQDLYNALDLLIKHTRYFPQVENDLQLYFFVTVLEKYPFAQKQVAEFPTQVDYFNEFIKKVPPKLKAPVTTLYHKLNDNESVVPAMTRSDFMFINEHGVAIAMENKFYRTEPSNLAGLRTKAFEALAQVYLTYELAQDKPAKMFREAKHHLYIGMGYYEDHRNMTLVFHQPPSMKLTVIEEYDLL